MRSYRRQILLACVALASVLSFSTTQAQDDESNPLGFAQAKTMILIGPVGGGFLSNHTGGFRVLNDPKCPVFTAGNGWGFLVGISGEIQPFKASWSIIPRILFESRPGHFKETLPDANIIHVIDTAHVEVLKQSVSTTSDIKYQTIALELMYGQHLVSLGKDFRLNLNIGPTIGYVLSGKITQVQDLEQPLNARFQNPDSLPSENSGRRLIYYNNQDIDGLNRLHFSIKGGLVAEVGLFNNDWIMYPGVFYDFGLNHITSTENWNLNSFVFQVDLRHAF